MSKEIFVIAGPNGAGKTSSTEEFIRSGLPVINGDLIHFELFQTHTSNLVSSGAAKGESKKRMNDLLRHGASFAFESNLAKENEWKQIEGFQKLGYSINLIFVSVSDLDILNERIQGRVNSGQGHYVDPVIVEQRYLEGLRLLLHNFQVPETLTLIDNSIDPTSILCVEKGRILFRADHLPKWVSVNLRSRLESGQGEKSRDVTLMTDIEQVRSRLAELTSTKSVLQDEDEDHEPEHKKSNRIKR